MQVVLQGGEVAAEQLFVFDAEPCFGQLGHGGEHQVDATDDVALALLDAVE